MVYVSSIQSSGFALSENGIGYYAMTLEELAFELDEFR